MTTMLPEWHRCAKCIGRPDEYTHPGRMNGEGRARWIEHMARACEGCPVCRECASEALENPRLAVGMIRAGACTPDGIRDKKETLAHWEQVARNG